MKIIHEETVIYNEQEDAHLDDKVIAQLWDDGDVSIKDLENESGVFISLNDLEQLVKSLQFNLKLHKENERYKKERGIL